MNAEPIRASVRIPQLTRKEKLLVPLSRLHEDFLASLKAERNVTRQTLVSYRSDWQTFFDFLRKVKRRRDELRYFQADILRDFQVWQSEQGLSAMTVNRRLASLSSFGKWLTRRDYLPMNPVDKVVRAPRVRNLPRYLHRHELRLLLGLPLPPSEMAMRALFCYAGLRRQELIDLEWRDLDFDGGYLHVRGKGGHHRVLPMLPAAMTALTEYALAVGPRGAVTSLFVGHQGRRVDRHIVNRIVRAWGTSIGRPLHPHLLRHTFATYLAEGRDLSHVQDALGHRSPETTRLYVQSRPASLRDSLLSFAYGVESKGQESDQTRLQTDSTA